MPEKWSPLESLLIRRSIQAALPPPPPPRQRFTTLPCSGTAERTFRAAFTNAESIFDNRGEHSGLDRSGDRRPFGDRRRNAPSGYREISKRAPNVYLARGVARS